MQVRKIFVEVTPIDGGISATCYRCKHNVTTRGKKALVRCFIKLNKTCPRGENHFYTAKREEANDWAFEQELNNRRTLWPPDSIRHLP